MVGGVQRLRKREIMLSCPKGRGHNMDQCRCRDCGRFVSYYAITKTSDGCAYCEGYEL